MEDESLLTQTQAFILETYRWRPVSVGGVAHRATKDIIWVGLYQCSEPWPYLSFNTAKLLYPCWRKRRRQSLVSLIS